MTSLAARQRLHGSVSRARHWILPGVEACNHTSRSYLQTLPLYINTSSPENTHVSTSSLPIADRPRCLVGLVLAKSGRLELGDNELVKQQWLKCKFGGPGTLCGLRDPYHSVGGLLHSIWDPVICCTIIMICRNSG